MSGRRAKQKRKLERGAVVAIPPKTIHRPPDGLILDVASKEECYQMGHVIGTGAANGFNIIIMTSQLLSHLINRIADVVNVTEGLAPKQQAIRLRAFFAAKGTALPIHQQILLASGDFDSVLEDYLPVAEVGLAPPLNTEQIRMLREAVSQTYHAVRAFEKSSSVERLADLRATLFNTAPIMQEIGEAVRKNSKLPRQTGGPEEDTLFVVERIADKFAEGMLIAEAARLTVKELKAERGIIMTPETARRNYDRYKHIVS